MSALNEPGSLSSLRLLIKSVRDRVSLPACRRVSFMETAVASWDRCFYFQRKTNIVEGLINRGVHDATRKRVSPPRSLPHFTFIYAALSSSLSRIHVSLLLSRNPGDVKIYSLDEFLFRFIFELEGSKD